MNTNMMENSMKSMLTKLLLLPLAFLTAHAFAAIASLNTDYQDRDDTLLGDAWFDATKFPTARFVSNAACTVTAVTVSCPGTFTLHGVSKPLGLAIEIDAKTQTLVGSAAINRHDFGVGNGEWDDSGLIGDTVKVEFRLGGLKAK